MTADASSWLSDYAGRYPLLREAATLAQQHLADALRSKPLNIHSIDVRAKTPDSVHAKVKKKSYADPEHQMTDVIGARIITGLSGDIDEVVTRLKSKFDVDDANSVDKRIALGADKFGYRSVHLVLTMHKPGVVSTAANMLSKMKIEVQVRTIVEHAWAEAEHSLKYKSGVQWPEELDRRFNALAATLEMIDREFDALTTGITDLVNSHIKRYEDGHLLDETFDTARFLAYAAVARPDAVALGPKPLMLPLRRASECVDALAEVGVSNARQLAVQLDRADFRALIREYADLSDVEPEAVSIAVCAGAVVALASLQVLRDYPSLNDAEIRRLFREEYEEEQEES